jgi:cyclopropane-fatty-acyl-phospholipid synthase
VSGLLPLSGLRTDKIFSFINHYIFPGGYLPSTTQLINHITTESAGTLIVEKIENIGGHYSKALRLWKEEFLANFEEKIRPALKVEHPEMDDEGIDVFRRKWEVRFSSSDSADGRKLTIDSTTSHIARLVS